MQKKLLKNITGDLLYSIAAMSVLNGVLQLVIYPFMNRYMGSSNAGNAISLMSIVAIVGASFGSSANHSRLIRRIHYEVSNGDFNIFLLISAMIAAGVAVVTTIIFSNNSIIFCVLFWILLIVSIARYYGDVEFRLSLNYKGYFLYYALIAIGYILGIGLYLLTRSWIMIIVTGEIISLIYVYFKGTIFRPFDIKRSEHFSDNMKSMVTLTGSNLLTTVASNADKILVLVFIGSLEVTVFHAASIMGKIISLFTVPMNSVLISYITKYRGEIKRKHFFLIGMVLLAVGMLMIIACMILSRLFVGVLYSNIYDDASKYFLTANAGQIFYFISSTYTLILLRFTCEAYQFAINCIYTIVFLAIAIPATIFFGLDGLVYAILIANTLKFMGVFAVGMWKIKGKKTYTYAND